MIVAVPGVVVSSAMLSMGLVQDEPAGCDAATQALREGGCAAVCRESSSQIVENALAQLGERIEHRGDEHVAGESADSIKMDVVVLSHDEHTPESHRGPRE